MAESQEFELELPEVEVDPREADVIQEPQQDQDFSEPEQEAAQTQESELDDYSDGVKKRIDKLTYRMREAERQREEAVKLAKQMAEQNAALQTKLQSSDTTLVNEYNNRVSSQKEQARKALKEAQELGDAEAIALATEAVAKTSLEEQNAQRLMNRQKQKAGSQPQVQAPVEQQLQPAPIDEKTEEWAEKNSWFGQDAEMRELFPTRFADETKNVQSSVAGTSRGAAPAKKGTRSVKLTPSQMAIAKRIGVPYEEYAKYV